MKIIGYGICGPGEANRYMRATLECFKRLCDEVIILCNNADKAEHDLIDEFGFKRVTDRREWGKFQWRIKQDFIERDIKQAAQVGDMLICLDMDEVLDKHLTREWIKAAPLDAYHVFIVDLWNEGYKPEGCFWNVRMWRWNGETTFKQKPVHCGLAPEWTYHYHRHAPFLLLHYGLKDKEDRMKKIIRYERYDPHAEHLDRKFYDMLKEDTCKPFNEQKIHDQIAKEVAAYKQTKPREPMNKPKSDRFAYVRNPYGEVIDIPERHVKETLTRKGFEFIGWADEQEKEIAAMFEDTNVGGDNTSPPERSGSYQRPMKEESDELDQANKNAKGHSGVPAFKKESSDSLPDTHPETSPLPDTHPANSSAKKTKVSKK